MTYFTKKESSGLGDSARAPKKLRVSNPFFIYSGTFIYILSGHFYLWRFLENAETIILDFTQTDFV